MKKFISTFALLLIVFPVASWPEDTDQVIHDTGRIESVQLYRDRAVVVRKIPFKNKPIIVLSGLPAGLYDETLTVRFLPNEKSLADEVRVKEIRVEKSFVETFTSNEARIADARLLKAKDRLAILSRQYAELNLEKKALLAIEPVSGKKTDTEKKDTVISLTYWKKLLGFVDTTLEQNLKSTGKLLGEIDDARTDLSIALAVAERYSSAQKKESRTVTIELDPNSLRWTGFLEVEYAIAGASWFPSYRYTLSGEGNGNAGLAFLALVSNETGEDWSNVSLSFSAADAGKRTRIPELKEWKIARVYPGRIADSGASGVADGESNERSRGMIAADVAKSSEERSMNDYDGGSGIAARKPEPAPKAEKKDKASVQMQQKLDESISNSRDYYIENFKTIQDDQAARKSKESRKQLDSLRKELNEQESRYRQKDFQNARGSANNVLGILNELKPEQKELFQPELERARQVIDWSYQYEKSRELKSTLRKPDQAAGTDTRYIARFKESIPSDGAFVSAFISEDRMDANLSYEINASSSMNAYLAATSKYRGLKPLLPGPVDVYFDDDYAGKTQLPIVRRGQDFTIRTGIDPDIEVQSFENRFEKSEGVFVEMVAYTIEKTIQIKNNRRKNINLIVYDRVPVATNSKIEVTDVKHSRKPDSEKRGMQTYKLTLKSGQVTELKTSFTLKHARDVRPVFSELNATGL